MVETVTLMMFLFLDFVFFFSGMILSMVFWGMVLLFDPFVFWGLEMSLWGGLKHVIVCWRLTLLILVGFKRSLKVVENAKTWPKKKSWSLRKIQFCGERIVDITLLS